MKPPPRVLVIRGGAIGDFILTLPAIRLLRETIADCHLEVIGYPSIAELARSAGFADSIRSLDHRTMAPLFARNAPIDEALAEHLRSFNLVVTFLYDPDGLFRATMERVGVKTLIECCPRVQNDGEHASRQLAKGLEKIAMFLEDEHLQRAHFERTPGGSNRVAIHLGSGSDKKNWPLENWLRLAGELGDHEVVFITGEAEEARGVCIGILSRSPNSPRASPPAAPSSVTTVASPTSPRHAACLHCCSLVPPIPQSGRRHSPG